MRKRTAEIYRTPVILAISNGLLRDSIKVALADVPALKVIGEARNSQEALATVKTAVQGNKVLLMGVTLAGGLPVPLSAIADEDLKAVLIAPASAGPDRILGYLSLGARAVVTNDIRMADLVHVLQLVSQGMVVLPASASQGAPHSWLSATKSGGPQLAPRERQLLELLAQGYSERHASEQLGISQRTIHSYLARLRGKLGAANRVHAAALAVSAHLVSPHRNGGPAEERILA
jgi:two-component system nitrate/nitrite response regulator NarL